MKEVRAEFIFEIKIRLPEGMEYSDQEIRKLI